MCCRAQERLQERLDKEHTRERDALLKELERAHQQHRDAVQQAQQGTAWYSVLVRWDSLQHRKPGSTMLFALMSRGINFCTARTGVRGALTWTVPGLQGRHE